MKKFLVMAFIALTVVGVASATDIVRPQTGGRHQKSSPNHIRGPICADRNTGVLYWIMARQQCLSNETRLNNPFAPGPQGQRGKAGAQGAAGPAGAQGAAGVAGAAGAKGDAGAQGATGAAGAKGEPGAAGAVGATGAVGPAGVTGPAGPAGSKGATGAQGPKGDPGLGDGLLWVCQSNGGNAKLAGTGATPDVPGLNGHDTCYQVVIKGGAQIF